MRHNHQFDPINEVCDVLRYFILTIHNEICINPLTLFPLLSVRNFNSDSIPLRIIEMLWSHGESILETEHIK